MYAQVHLRGVYWEGGIGKEEIIITIESYNNNNL